ncbi:MAG: sugar ABC transporter substrate-binding protein [Anaerolineae bacterium]
MHFNRRLIALLILAAMLISMVPVSAQEVTLRYFMWDPSFEETEREMADICAAELGINVEMEVIGTPDYWTRLQAAAAAEDLPDVFSMSSGFVDEWAADGLMLNIQEYVDRDIMPEAENYFTGLFDVARYPDKVEGDMYAFPFAFVETVLFYNRDMFDEAGLEYPDPEGWTWEEFLDAAKALTQDKNDDGVVDQYGFWFYGRYAHIESWIYQNGGRLLSPDRTQFAPDEQAVEALAFLDSLIHEHGVAPEPAEMEGIRQQDVFPLGMAAMWVDGAWNIANNRTQLEGQDVDWALAPIPRGPSWEEDTAYGWPDLMAIAPNTAHPEEAWQFVRCMTGPLRTVERTFPGKIPIYRPTAESEAWLEPDQKPDNKGFLLEWAQFTGPTSFTPGWGEWRGYTDGAGLQGQLDAVFNGEKSLEDALAEVTEYANGVLARFYGE